MPLMVQPCCRKGAGNTADICIWDTTTSRCSKVLSYHPIAVQALAFSRDGCWLASIGRDPERSAVIWDVLRGEAVAVGRTDKPLHAVAWRHGAVQPEFVTVGGDGALLWTLEPTHLAQRGLSIPEVCIWVQRIHDDVFEHLVAPCKFCPLRFWSRMQPVRVSW
jgi:hypothetical protein